MRIKTAGAGALAAAMVLGSVSAAHADDQWRAVPLNWSWPERKLNDVEAVGVNDVWAVGGQGRVYVAIPGDLGRPPITLVDIGHKPLIQHWTGRSWTGYSAPGIAGEGEISDVEAVAPDDVWVSGFVGYRGTTPYLAHWDGTKWTQIDPPSNLWGADIYTDEQGLWLRDRGHFYRFADGRWVEHSPGETVNNVRQSVSGDLYAFSGESEKIFHWNGGSWTSFDRLPDDTYYFFDNYYTATADGELWAISRDGTEDTVPAVHRWNGSAWAKVPVPSSYTGTWYHSIYDLGGPVIEFKMRGDDVYHQLRWTGSAWTELSDPADSLPPNPVVAGDGSVWAGGGNTAYRLVGKTWTPVQVPLSGYVTVTALPGSRHVFAWSKDAKGELLAATTAP